jgi:hypothetical protein
MIYYSKLNNKFYDTVIHSEYSIPENCILIDEEEYTRIRLELTSTNSKLLSYDETGYPIVIDKPQITYEEASSIIRNKRDKLLADTDWTDTVSAKERLGGDYYIWQTYRQQLRDITEDSGFPFNVIFPDLPNL